MSDGIGGARFDAVAAENTAGTINVVDVGIALARGDAGGGCGNAGTRETGSGAARKSGGESTGVRETGSGVAKKTAIENAGIREAGAGAGRMREVGNAETRETRSGAAEDSR